MQIHGYYRATGASITKAQAEFATNVFSNEGVRNAAASAAAAGVRQGFSVRNIYFGTGSVYKENVSFSNKDSNRHRDTNSR